MLHFTNCSSDLVHLGLQSNIVSQELYLCFHNTVVLVQILSVLVLMQGRHDSENPLSTSVSTTNMKLPALWNSRIHSTTH